MIWPFYPPNGLNFSFADLISFLYCSELIRVQFYFISIFLFDPSWPELIRPGVAVRVDPVRLLYCHYVAKNIPTEEDMNEEYLAPYPVWFLC